MKKYLSKILILFITAVLCFGGMVIPVSAENIDTNKVSSLKIVYNQENTRYEGLEVEIYRVASVKNGYTFELEAPFRNYRVNINDVESQGEWRSAATTLSAYAVADGLTPTATGTTDENGIVEFKNLRPGMYLTMGIYKEVDRKFVAFENFLTVIPYPSNDGESYLYDLTVYPKCRVTEPREGTIPYKVVKHWKDEGQTYGRTKEVTIDIIKNGVVDKTVTLSAENDWTYTWRANIDGSEWRVVERNVPQGYFVSVSEEETTFLVTNTVDQENPPTPPDDSDKLQTGDTSSTELYCILICVSGLLITIISFDRKRRMR